VFDGHVSPTRAYGERGRVNRVASAVRSVWNLRKSVLAGLGVVALAGAAVPSLPGCGTVLSLVVLLAPPWNASPAVTAFATILLTLSVYALPLVIALRILRGTTEVVRMGAVGAWTAAYLILLLAVPHATDCP
jgi:hypothetical protein